MFEEAQLILQYSELRKSIQSRKGAHNAATGFTIIDLKDYEPSTSAPSARSRRDRYHLVSIPGEGVHIYDAIDGHNIASTLIGSAYDPVQAPVVAYHQLWALQDKHLICADLRTSKWNKVESKNTYEAIATIAGQLVAYAGTDLHVLDPSGQPLQSQRLSNRLKGAKLIADEKILVLIGQEEASLWRTDESGRLNLSAVQSFSHTCTTVSTAKAYNGQIYLQDSERSINVLDTNGSTVNRLDWAWPIQDYTFWSNFVIILDFQGKISCIDMQHQVTVGSLKLSVEAAKIVAISTQPQAILLLVADKRTQLMDISTDWPEQSLLQARLAIKNGVSQEGLGIINELNPDIDETSNQEADPSEDQIVQTLISNHNHPTFDLKRHLSLGVTPSDLRSALQKPSTSDILLLLHCLSEVLDKYISHPSLLNKKKTDVPALDRTLFWLSTILDSNLTRLLLDKSTHESLLHISSQVDELESRQSMASDLRHVLGVFEEAVSNTLADRLERLEASQTHTRRARALQKYMQVPGYSIEELIL